MEKTQTQHCQPCEGIGKALDSTAIKNLMPQLAKEWQVSNDNKSIFRDFRFRNFYQTMAFVNAIAWSAHLENHHPDLEIGFNHCLVRYTTHALDGLSQNDFICAAKADTLFSPATERLKL